LATTSGFKNVGVDIFLGVLENIVDERKLTAARTFDMDETTHKIKAGKGKHDVGAITSCERGHNAASASGFYVPPLLIYSRKRIKESLAYGEPPGIVHHCQDKGWMDAQVFCEWMHHLKPMPQEKVQLISSAHSSHNQRLLLTLLANLVLSCWHCRHIECSLWMTRFSDH
jgi:hypothetical protein